MQAEKTKIPATVSLLTHNSAATLARALRSVAAFSDVLVCDGDSTDATVSLARAAGARVIAQDARAKGAEGRLIDWSLVRNQCLLEGRYPWHLYLDSDEYLSEELVEEVRAVVELNSPAVYWVPRLYELRGTIIRSAASYPNRQMRFFHRDAVSEFRKPVHERLVVSNTTPVRVFTEPLYVPIEGDLNAARKKSARYIALEVARHTHVTLGLFVRSGMGALRVWVLYGARLVRNHLFQQGPHLPLSYEWETFRYQGVLVLAYFRRLFQ